MKTGIHPTYQDTTVTCSSCGTVWQTRSTKPQMRVELCSVCHPFYTGQQRIVDTAGQVERFMRRLNAASEEPRRKKSERRQSRLDARRRMRSTEEQLLVVSDDNDEPESK